MLNLDRGSVVCSVHGNVAQVFVLDLGKRSVI